MPEFQGARGLPFSAWNFRQRLLVAFHSVRIGTYDVDVGNKIA